MFGAAREAGIETWGVKASAHRAVMVWSSPLSCGYRTMAGVMANHGGLIKPLRDAICVIENVSTRHNM